MTISEQELQKQEKEWQDEKLLLDRKINLDNEKKLYKEKAKKKISTSKKLIFFLFLNCTILEIFVGYVTVESLRISSMMGTFMDFSPLITIVGAVVSEVIGFAIYAIKSAKENCAGGIVYETAMLEQQNSTYIDEENVRAD